MRYNKVPFRTLLNETLVAIEQHGDELVFFTRTGEIFRMNHSQDCCEEVTIESIVGELIDILDSPILLAEESVSSKHPEGCDKKDCDVSFTWTFYKLATIKGYVDIRWFGESNGYYSESVDLYRVMPDWVRPT